MAVGKITSRAIENGAITADQIATGAITVADISDGEITAAKLHTTLDFSTKTFTMHNNHVTQAMVTQHESALSVTASQVTDLATYLTNNDFDTATNIVAAITDSAPATLDTLNELAAALGDDPNFATTTANNIALKAPIDNPSFTGNVTVGSGATARGSYSDILIAPGGDNAQIEMWGANTSFAISHFDNDRLGIYSNVSGSWDENRGINIKADGNVGIGRTSPATKLHVADSTTNAYSSTITKGSNHSGLTLVQDDGMTGVFFATGGAGAGSHWSAITGSRSSGSNWATQLNFYTHPSATSNLDDANQRMIITGEGNVGIGTDDPATNLHVMGSLTLEGSSGTDNAWTYYKNADRTYLLGIRGSSNDALSFYDLTADAERMRIDTSGNVGIGTDSPFADLTVGTSTAFDNGDNYITAAFQPAINGGDSAGILFGHYPVSGYAKQGIFWERYVGASGSGGRGKLHFVNRDQSDTSVPTIADTRMTIEPGGKVGIGTADPSWKFTVEGSSDNDWISRIYNTSSNGYGTLIRSDATAANDTTALGVYADGDYRLVVNSTGRVGIGTQTPQSQVHIYQAADSGNNYNQGTIQLGGTSATLGLGISYNALGSGRANITGLNTSGGQNNRISLGFGAIQSYGEPATRVLTVDQSNYVHHTPPGNARFMPMITAQSVTRHGAYPTHPGGDAVGTGQSNATQIGFAQVYQRNWSAGRYIHMKTNIPCTGSNFGMVLVYAKGYRYSPGGIIDSSWGFHNWGNAIYSLVQQNYSSAFAVNCYTSSDNYVVLVGDNTTAGSSTYTGFRLDFMYSNTNYPAHTETASGQSHYLIGTSLATSTSGAY